jgi:beta-glucosidase
MKNKILKFPDGFLWGAATSAHQVEGGTKNDWTEWEVKNAKRLAKEAKTKWEKWQQEKFPEMFEPKNYISGRACDHYNRYEEDFDIAQSLGHNAHRFSIEWSRIEPQEGKFDEKEINHYRKVLKAIRARGIEPFVTLWHFTNPIWIGKIGGWENRRTINCYLRFVKKIIESFPDVQYWTTFNEPNIYVGYSYIRGSQPPGIKNYIKAICVFRNILKAHKRAYSAIKKGANSSSVGLVSSVIYFDVLNDSFINRSIKYLADYFWNFYSFDKIIKSVDFIGVNYYTRKLINFDFRKSKKGKISDLSWEIFPEGIYQVIKDLGRYNKPIYITENGIADADDTKRKKFVKEHLQFIYAALRHGVDVRGYFYWSFLEIFEMVEMRGFWPRFGLVEVDYKTMKREIRPSAREYAKICKENCLKI